MKRILFIVFSILNVLTLSSCGSSSEKSSTTTTQPYNKVTIENINDFEIDYNEDNTATITKYVGEPVEVIVPNTVIKDGIEYSVKTIGRDAFRNNRKITYVFISEGITHIELGAFYGCEYLVRISIPNSAEYIGDSAFMMCWGLRQDYIEYDNGYYLGNSNNPFIILMDVKDTPFESLEINPEAKFIYYQSISGASNLKSLYIDPESHESRPLRSFSGSGYHH